MRRVLTSVQGVSDFKRARSNDDRFAFIYRGRPCVVHEPFGDNSRYWVGPVETDPPIDMTAVRDAFSQFWFEFTFDPDFRSSNRLARLRLALYALGCLFIFAIFFSTSARLDDMNVSTEERVAIFSWTDLRLRFYVGGALCSFLAAIVLSIWPRPRRE
jgi:hypothetical protein